jgi:hypothetical protein
MTNENVMIPSNNCNRPERVQGDTAGQPNGTKLTTVERRLIAFATNWFYKTFDVSIKDITAFFLFYFTYIKRVI